MAENKSKKKIVKEFVGTVVADNLDKTITVRVASVKIHPLYNKRYKRDKNYKVHDPQNKFKIEDEVKFIPSRPFSKDKKWQVIY
ncbi:MAG: 30S ribosomal protein S17 [Candidatus Moranbacteria bacterium]|nr:30S ribosomal protein S17 [Candidatus Moranbacteria bacterium]